MTTRKLERSERAHYFDEVAKRIPSMRVAVVVLGEDIGVQPETEDSALIGISYDENEDLLTVDTPNVSHRIASPSELYVEERAGTLASVQVVTEDGMKQIIELKPLPSLPAS